MRAFAAITAVIVLIAAGLLIMLGNRQAVAAPTVAECNPMVAGSGISITSEPLVGTTYGIDESILIAVQFTKPVNVTGKPIISVQMDPTYGVKTAEYDSGSGTDTLVFKYDVAVPNLSSKGIAVVPNSLVLSYGTYITEAGGARQANLAHSGLCHDPDHKVDAAYKAPTPVPPTPTPTPIPPTPTPRPTPNCTGSLLTDPLVTTTPWLTINVVSSNVDSSNVDSRYRVQATWETNSGPVICQANGYWIEWKPTSRDVDVWDGPGFWVSGTNAEFRYSNFPHGEYEFRVKMRDYNNQQYESNDVTRRIGPAPATPPSVHNKAPQNLEVWADNDMGINLDWDAPSLGSGETFRYYEVQWNPPHSAAQSERLCEDNTADPPVCEDVDETQYRIRGLTNSIVSAGKYTGGEWQVRVYHAYRAGTTDTGQWTPWYTVQPFFEPMHMWFVNGTPLYNRKVGRTFMMVDTNKPNSSATCNWGSGSVNCPPQTLVSGNIPNSGKDVRHMSANANRETPIFNGSTIWESTSIPPAAGALRGPQAPAMWSSGGDGQIYVGWGKPAYSDTCHSAGFTDVDSGDYGNVDGYKVQYRSSADGGNSWTAWDANEVVLGVNARSHLFTDLASGAPYQVRVLATADGDYNCDGDTDDHITDPPGADPIVWPYGAEGPVDGMASPSQTHWLTDGTTVPAKITDYDTEIGTGKLKVSWEPPDDGDSLIYGYTVTLSHHSGSSVLPLRRVSILPDPDWVGHQVGVSEHHCTQSTDVAGKFNSNHQSIYTCTPALTHEFTGLEQGERYGLSIRAHNANGNSYTDIKFDGWPTAVVE